MPSPINTPSIVTVTGGTDGGATETVVATVPNVITSNIETQVLIEGTLNVLTGAGTTSMQVRCRRGTTIAGPQVGGTVAFGIGATSNGAVSFSFKDTPGEVHGQSYVITVVESSATTDGTIEYLVVATRVSAAS